MPVPTGSFRSAENKCVSPQGDEQKTALQVASDDTGSTKEVKGTQKDLVHVDSHQKSSVVPASMTNLAASDDTGSIKAVGETQKDLGHVESHQRSSSVSASITNSAANDTGSTKTVEEGQKDLRHLDLHQSSSVESASTTNRDADAQVCNAEWGRCGGLRWTRTNCCTQGYECVAKNDWYHQCVPVER